MKMAVLIMGVIVALPFLFSPDSVRAENFVFDDPLFSDMPSGEPVDNNVIGTEYIGGKSGLTDAPYYFCTSLGYFPLSDTYINTNDDVVFWDTNNGRWKSDNKDYRYVRIICTDDLVTVDTSILDALNTQNLLLSDIVASNSVIQSSSESIDLSTVTGFQEIIEGVYLFELFVMWFHLFFFGFMFWWYMKNVFHLFDN